MKLLLLPLALLVIVSILSITGLGSTILGDMGVGGDPSATTYYDSTGHAVVYANGSAIGEAGKFYNAHEDLTWINGTSIWDNIVTEYYYLYWDNAGTYKIAYADMGKTQDSGSLGTLSLSTSLGFIILIVGLMALAVIVGLRVLGSGTANSMVLVLGTAYLGVWAVFSVLAMPLITSMPIFGNIMYFILTLIFTLGIVKSFQGAGDAD